MNARMQACFMIFESRFFALTIDNLQIVFLSVHTLIIDNVLCSPTSRTVRCSKCTNYVKHRKRKTAEWQPSTMDSPDQTVLSPRAKIARTSLWRSEEDVVHDVLAAYELQDRLEQRQQLERVARHLAIEGEL